jgi:hypothetical protein
MICDKECDGFVSFKELSLGNSFDSWKHPLAPTRFKDGKYVHIPARHTVWHLDQWSSMAYRCSTEFLPSESVAHAESYKRSLAEILKRKRFGVWITGSENSNASVLSWIDVHVPVFLGNENEEGEFIEFIKKLTRLASMSSSNLAAMLKKTFKSVQQRTMEEYWANIESPFENLLLDYSKEKEPELVESWEETLRKTCLSIFDSESETLNMDCYSDAALAKKELLKRLSKKAFEKELSKI